MRNLLMTIAFLLVLAAFGLAGFAVQDLLSKQPPCALYQEPAYVERPEF